MMIWCTFPQKEIPDFLTWLYEEEGETFWGSTKDSFAACLSHFEQSCSPPGVKDGFGKAYEYVMSSMKILVAQSGTNEYQMDP